VLGLSAKDTAALPELPDPMVLWQARGRTSRYCELVATTWEAGILGNRAVRESASSPIVTGCQPLDLCIHASRVANRVSPFIHDRQRRP